MARFVQHDAAALPDSPRGRYHHHSPPHSGENQPSTRHAEQAGTDIPCRVETRPQGVPSPVHAMGRADDRRMRDIAQQSVTPVLLPSPRRPSSSRGCTESELAGPISVRLSPPGDVVSISCQSRIDKRRTGPANRPTVATIGLVSDDRQPTGGTTSLAKTGAKTTRAATQQPHARRHTESSSDCVATIKGALAKDGYSDEVIHTMLLSRTTGTMAVVQSRWAAWFTWCRDAGVDPLRCTSPELCQYLSTLFEGGKAVGTIKGYLSSISTTIKLSMKRDVSSLTRD